MNDKPHYWEHGRLWPDDGRNDDRNGHDRRDGRDGLRPVAPTDPVAPGLPVAPTGASGSTGDSSRTGRDGSAWRDGSDRRNWERGYLWPDWRDGSDRRDWRVVIPATGTIAYNTATGEFTVSHTSVYAFSYAISSNVGGTPINIGLTVDVNGVGQYPLQWFNESQQTWAAYILLSLTTGDKVTLVNASGVTLDFSGLLQLQQVS